MTYRKYKRLPNFNSSIDSLSGGSGGESYCGTPTRFSSSSNSSSSTLKLESYLSFLTKTLKEHHNPDARPPSRSLRQSSWVNAATVTNNSKNGDQSEESGRGKKASPVPGVSAGPDITLINKYYGLVPKKFAMYPRPETGKMRDSLNSSKVRRSFSAAARAEMKKSNHQHNQEEIHPKESLYDIATGPHIILTTQKMPVSSSPFSQDPSVRKKRLLFKFKGRSSSLPTMSTNNNGSKKPEAAITSNPNVITIHLVTPVTSSDNEDDPDEEEIIIHKSIDPITTTTRQNQQRSTSPESVCGFESPQDVQFSCGEEKVTVGMDYLGKVRPETLVLPWTQTKVGRSLSLAERRSKFQKNKSILSSSSSSTSDYYSGGSTSTRTTTTSSSSILTTTNEGEEENGHSFDCSFECVDEEPMVEDVAPPDKKRSVPKSVLGEVGTMVAQISPLNEEERLNIQVEIESAAVILNAMQISMMEEEGNNNETKSFFPIDPTKKNKSKPGFQEKTMETPTTFSNSSAPRACSTLSSFCHGDDDEDVKDAFMFESQGREIINMKKGNGISSCPNNANFLPCEKTTLAPGGRNQQKLANDEDKSHSIKRPPQRGRLMRSVSTTTNENGNFKEEMNSSLPKAIVPRRECHGRHNSVVLKRGVSVDESSKLRKRVETPVKHKTSSSSLLLLKKRKYPGGSSQGGKKGEVKRKDAKKDAGGGGGIAMKKAALKSSITASEKKKDTLVTRSKTIEESKRQEDNVIGQSDERVDVPSSSIPKVSNPLKRQPLSLDETCMRQMSLMRRRLGRDDLDKGQASSLSNSASEKEVPCGGESEIMGKKEECVQVFQKMNHRGVSLNLDTIYRAMMTPSEYRIFMTKEAERMKKGEENSSNDVM